MKHEDKVADTSPSRGGDVEAASTTEQDAVFGDLSADGPDYRSVSALLLLLQASVDIV